MVMNILASLSFFLMFYKRLNLYLLIPISIIIMMVGFWRKSHHSHNSFLLMDKYARNNTFREIDPRDKLIFVLLSIFFIVGTKSLVVSLFYLILTTILTMYSNKLNFKEYINALGLPLGFIFLSILGILLEFPKENLGYLDMNIFGLIVSVTKNTQETAIRLLAVALSSLTLLVFFGTTTPVGDFIAALRRSKLSKSLVEIMYMIYRYVFILIFVLTQLHTSATSRLGFENYKKTLSSTFMIASRLFNQSFKKARISLEAMESRLYDGNLRFIEKENYSNKYRIYLFGILIIAFVIWILGRVI